VFVETGSFDKLISKSKWDPRVKFTDGIKVMVKWVLDNG